ncbi:hypothetical protein [Rhodopseudomonas faecalis]|uniref:hypothetical protein n=1 Tax=Rhodopseudomonas faecalis TaxID=99655 RepID=UPI000DA17200|nr:hypothetical protein [Rhodopseudomonas faecalis]
MDVVRELCSKHDELRSVRQELIDQIAKIDRDIAAIDTVIQIYKPDHTLTKSKTRRSSTRGTFLGGLFADDNLSARILNTLRLAQVPISSHECAIRVALQKNVPEDDPRMPEIANRVAISLSGLAKRSRVEPIRGDGRSLLWKVAA